MNLTKVKEIQLAINSLSPEEARYLHHWLSQKDWTDWEQQIEQDAQAGKLDFLMDEAFEEKKTGLLKEI